MTSLTQTLAPKSPPLREAEGGVLRVSGTRVPLDTIVYAFQSGASAEEIVMAYDSLSLADVYAVISYYLENRTQVEQYLGEQREVSRQMREQFPPRENWQTIRDRLLARRAARGT